MTLTERRIGLGAFLGVDLGGSGAKAGVFDGSGNLLGFGRVSYTPSDADGHYEIPIDEIYSAARNASLTAISAAGVDVRSMAVSSQGQTFVSVDGDGNALHPAIMWYDARAEAEANDLRSRLLSAAGDTPVPNIRSISPSAKIVWLRSRYPSLMTRARKYLLLPEYIAWRMTGEAVTDTDTATSSGFYRYDADGYSREALIVAGVDEKCLARIQMSGSAIGRIRPEVAADWGLSHEAVLVTGANDQYCGALGAGICRPGIASVTSGTCLALVTLTEQLPGRQSLGISYGRFPIRRYLFALAYERSSGLVLDWFRREFCGGRSFAELEADASKVPPGSRGAVIDSAFYEKFSTGSSQEIRAYICNLARKNTLKEIYRSMLESLTYRLQDKVDLMKSNELCFEAIRCIGGGSKSDLWLQMKADVTGLRVERPKVTESATLGAAILASVGVEEQGSIADRSAAFYQIERVFDPDQQKHQIYKSLYAAYE